MSNASRLPPASSEQMSVVNALKSGSNIILNAVAGSGKTTTALHVATECPIKLVLLLTYNSKLKEETRKRTKELNLNNIEAHSFHAMGFKYYGDDCCRDPGLTSTITFDRPPRRNLPNYDIIIIDEAQDMEKILYSFVCKLFRDIRDRYQNVPSMLVVGDVNEIQIFLR